MKIFTLRWKFFIEIDIHQGDENYFLIKLSIMMKILSFFLTSEFPSCLVAPIFHTPTTRCISSKKPISKPTQTNEHIVSWKSKVWANYARKENTKDNWGGMYEMSETKETVFEGKDRTTTQSQLFRRYQALSIYPNGPHRTTHYGRRKRCVWTCMCLSPDT